MKKILSGGIKPITSLHSVKGWYPKVKAKVAKKSAAFRKDLKDPGFLNTAKLKDYKKMFHG
jgi:hypothetical protein